MCLLYCNNGEYILGTLIGYLLLGVVNVRHIRGARRFLTVTGHSLHCWSLIVTVDNSWPNSAIPDFSLSLNTNTCISQHAV